MLVLSHVRLGLFWRVPLQAFLVRLSLGAAFLAGAFFARFAAGFLAAIFFFAGAFFTGFFTGLAVA